MKKKKIKAPIQLILVIVERGDGEKVIEYLRSKNSHSYLSFMGEGTSKNATSDFFGFGIIEREAVLGFVDSDKASDILDELYSIMHMENKHNGIAMLLPIGSCASTVFDMLKIPYEKGDKK